MGDVLVEIYSDVVCPWCAIGKARFEKALAQFPDRDKIEVVWRAYQLDPTAPVTPSPVIDGYARKFGGPEKARQIIDHVTQVAADEGIAFDMDIAQRANTFDAHRLLWFALEHHGRGTQNDLKEALLRAYFSEGRDIANHAVLADCAAAVGIDQSTAAEFLESGGGVREVRAELDGAIERGVSAVPTFVFDGKWAVPGAQDPDVFLRVFDRLAAREPEVAAAKVCSVDDPSC